MRLSVTTFPAITELVQQTQTVDAIAETTAEFTESNVVITSFTSNPSDVGLTLSFSGTRATVTGEYMEQFVSEIGWAEPQVNLLTRPVYHEDSNWSMVPDPTDTANFFFLYKYQAPDVLTTTITYTVAGTFDRTEIPPEDEIPPLPRESVPMTFSLTVTQVVNYDLPENIRQFRRYI